MRIKMALSQTLHGRNIDIGWTRELQMSGKIEGINFTTLPLLKVLVLLSFFF